MTTQTHEFKSEARQLLHLMIHSLYSNKEIFLRELISNASDALDKLRLESLQDKELVAPDHKYGIKISFDPEIRTLTIEDNGIGMSREEAIKQLGTIAHSGTAAFVEELHKAEQGSEEAQAHLIGQFGVGFYSAYMVADKVEVVTRRAGEENATLWRSDGGDAFEIDDAIREGNGTTITLFLKGADPDNQLPDFCDQWVIRRTIKTYSDFVTYPIELRTEEPGEDEKSTTVEWETVNSMKAVWQRSESDVSDEEYNEFYKHIARDWTDPFARMRLHAEGTFEYTALLYVPERAPFDLYYRDMKYGLQLYVQRVLIMEQCTDLLPVWLRFMRGVVESPDLSLNVSREILQKDNRVGQIRKRLVKKVLDTLGDMQSDEKEKYFEFWKQFGPVLKEGLAQDPTHKERLTKLMLFPSTHDGQAQTTFAEYKERMPEGQDAIYYIIGENRTVAENSPHLEAFRAKGYEVLLLIDPVDEFMADSLQEIDGTPFKSVVRGNVDLKSEDERKAAEEELAETQKTHESLFERMQQLLDDHIKEVRLSNRLSESAACLVSDEGDITPGLERMLKAAGHEAPTSKRILEINPGHPILTALQSIYDADRSDQRIETYTQLLYGQSLLAEGAIPPNPADFSKKVAELMVAAAG